jgi:NAD(P)-dependent dehydrogenase (short-subunit alcohol dehydrogenase family)
VRKPLASLVTGGSRGIGRAIALALASDGADVAVNYRRDEEAALQTVRDIEAMGRRAGAYAASVDDHEADEAMVRQIEQDLGSVGILVNNAGVASRGRSVIDTDPGELMRVVSTHAFGAHYLSRLVIPAMRELDRGDIIMISSAATKSNRGNGGPYNMAKAAMEALAYTLAKEERPYNIRVNIIAPGLVETEMGRRLMKASAGVDDLRDLDAVMPFGRVCQPEDIANAVRYFVSADNSYATGERIYVDGGGQNAGRPASY